MMHKHRLRKSISVIKHPAVVYFKYPKIGSKTNRIIHEKSEHGCVVCDRSRRLYEPVFLQDTSYT